MRAPAAVLVAGLALVLAAALLVERALPALATLATLAGLLR